MYLVFFHGFTAKKDRYFAYMVTAKLVFFNKQALESEFIDTYFTYCGVQAKRPETTRKFEAASGEKLSYLIPLKYCSETTSDRISESIKRNTAVRCVSFFRKFVF